MCENWSKNDSKLPLGGCLGPLLEALGAMWVPRGAPRDKITKLGTVTHPVLGPNFRPFLLFFRNLKDFVVRFFRVSF